MTRNTIGLLLAPLIVAGGAFVALFGTAGATGNHQQETSCEDEFITEERVVGEEFRFKLQYLKHGEWKNVGHTTGWLTEEPDVPGFLEQPKRFHFKRWVEFKSRDVTETVSIPNPEYPCPTPEPTETPEPTVEPTPTSTPTGPIRLDICVDGEKVRITADEYASEPTPVDGECPQPEVEKPYDDGTVSLQRACVQGKTISLTVEEIAWAVENGYGIPGECPTSIGEPAGPVTPQTPPDAPQPASAGMLGPQESSTVPVVLMALMAVLGLGSAAYVARR